MFAGDSPTPRENGGLSQDYGLQSPKRAAVMVDVNILHV